MSEIVTIDRQDAGLTKLAKFVRAFDAIITRTTDEATILHEGRQALAALITTDDWLPEVHAAPGPVRYRQYLLYRDPDARFSIVSFVWGPGQATPIHDHRVWGLVGMLRGEEIAEHFERHGGTLRRIGGARLKPGEIETVSPALGDVHRVSNGFDDRVSISIHVYGADIGAVERATYDIAGNSTPFVSGYADAPVPFLNLGAA